MPVLNIAMIGSDELAREIAKATDQRDVHTYVHKELTDGEAKIISIIRPARFPERLRPLLNAISAGRVGLIEINEIDATLGEVIVAFASSSIKRGIAVIRPLDGGWVDQDMVEKMSSGADSEKVAMIQSEFRDWLKSTGNAMHVGDLLKMERTSTMTSSSSPKTR